MVMINYNDSSEWIPAAGLTLENNAINAVKNEDNILVVAGPGAGKTELLAQKAGYLFSTNLCPTLKKILAISFKKDSSENLKERIEHRYGKEYGNRFTSLTYDAFAKRVLDQFRMALPEESRPAINYNVGDKEAIRNAFDECGFQNTENMPEYNLNNFFDNKLTSVSLPLKNDGLNDNVWRKLLKGSEKVIPTLTFKMISLLATYIFQSNPYLIRSLRQTYSHVFLDEFQDTTDIQYNLVKMCFQNSNSIITAVGDSKQRIMVWAGARQTVFQDFQKDFSASKIELLMNHRSAPKLVELQKMMYEALSENPANISTSEKWDQEDGEIALLLTEDDLEEAEYIAKDINLRIEKGLKPRNICILVKQTPNNYVNKIIEKLKNYQISARIESEYQDLLKEFVVKLIVNFMKLSINRQSPDEREFIMDTIMVLKGIGSANSESKYNEEQRNLTYILDASKEKMMSAASLDDLNVIIQDILSYFGTQRLKTLNPAYLQGTYFEKIIEKVKNFLWIEYEETSDWTEAIDNFLGENSIPIMTIHKSKGLEYDVVYFVGLEDGAFWTFKKQPEEDRRAFFVAISRAKEFLIFTYCKRRKTLRFPNQQRNNINEFYDLLQQPRIANVINLTKQ